MTAIFDSGLDSGAAPVDARRTEVLELRARRLARVPPAAAAAATRTDLAIVRVGGREVGLPARAVREISPRAEVTPLAAALAGGGELVGITQVRGRLLGVADLGRLLGEGAAPRPDATRPLVIAEGPSGALGLLVDAVVGFRQVGEDELAETFWDEGGARAVPIAGVTRDLVTILDLDLLLSTGGAR